MDLTTDDWAGISRFFADHTVITGAPLSPTLAPATARVTTWMASCPGMGEWSYQSNQDVMPTWTWIIDSEGGALRRL